MTFMSAPSFILLIDVDPLLIETLEELAVYAFPDVRFRQVSKSGDAKEYIISGKGPLPDVIWLSVNLLNRRDELELLAWLRASSATRSLPVLLLADGILSCDVIDSYTFDETSFTLRPYNQKDWKNWLAHQMKLARSHRFILL